MKIEIVNRTEEPLSEKEFQNLANCAEKILQLPKKASISFFFVEQPEIRKLNNWTRKIDKVTDVLSFPFQDKKKYEKNAEGDIFLGDIVICPVYALDIAGKQGRHVEKELYFLAVHGILHLCGFDHGTNKDESKMDKEAKKIFDCYTKE